MARVRLYWTEREKRAERNNRNAKKDRIWNYITAAEPTVADHLTKAQTVALYWAELGSRRPNGEFPEEHRDRAISVYSGFSYEKTFQSLVNRGLAEFGRPGNPHETLEDKGSMITLTPKGRKWGKRLMELYAIGKGA